MQSSSTAMLPPAKYLDFDPHCTWSQDENSKILILDIPGFKKEQLNILVDTRRKLKIKGERYIDGGQLTRFSKHLLVPKHCDIMSIRATFDMDDGLLSVTLPRSVAASRRSFGVDDIKDRIKFRTFVFAHYDLKKALEGVRKKLCVWQKREIPPFEDPFSSAPQQREEVVNDRPKVYRRMNAMKRRHPDEYFFSNGV